MIAPGLTIQGVVGAPGRWSELEGTVPVVIMTYNVQAGLGIDGVRDISRAGRLVAELGADIAGLQEVEVGNPRSHLVNQPARLAESSGMHVGFAHGFQRATWRFGNCLLSRWPIVRCNRVPLPGMKEHELLWWLQSIWMASV
jgi:endonuclease/exonuclease/phosphatase family metal-dependent hydrolase